VYKFDNLIKSLTTMKKILLSTVFALLFVANVHGKPPAYGGMTDTNTTSETKKFGVKFKPHFSRFIWKNDVAKNILLRPSFDVFGEYSLSDGVGLQLSLGYSGQGQGMEIGELDGEKIELREFFNYVMLSVMPRFYPGSDRQFCFFIGPRVGWLASAKALVLIDGKKKEEGNLLGEGQELFKRFDGGILLGLDYEFDAGILLGGDCNIGITNLLKKESENNSVRTFSGGITLGYNFAKLLN